MEDIANEVKKEVTSDVIEGYVTDTPSSTSKKSVSEKNSGKNDSFEYDRELQVSTNSFSILLYL